MARTTVAMTAPRISEKNSFILSNQVKSHDNHINHFDAGERNNDAAHAIDQQVALKYRQRTNGLVGYAAQRERNQRDDDERVENDGAQNGAGRAVQAHDVQ